MKNISAEYEVVYRDPANEFRICRVTNPTKSKDFVLVVPKSSDLHNTSNNPDFGVVTEITLTENLLEALRLNNICLSELPTV